jgi:AcrR family transcriptional regulator
MTDRKEMILEQALELVIDHGLGELTMAKVAQRMEFTEPAMYRHFRNKQELVIGLIERLAAAFDRLFQEMDREQPPEPFFLRYFDALVLHLERVRGVTILFLSESAFRRDQVIREDLWRMFQAQTGRVASYLELAKSRGEVRGELDAAAAALVFIGMVQAFTTRFLLASQAPSTAGSRRQAVDLFLKGVVA